MRLRIWLCGLILVGSTIAIFFLFSRSAPRLNVILVTFDTTRADRLGAYGYTKGLTTAFDEFAKRSVVFDRAYAPAPLTLPSHATMLTGLYPPEHGLRINGRGRLTNDIPILSEILKKSGYDTGAFVAAHVLNSKFGLSRGFDIYDDEISNNASSDHPDESRRDGKQVVDAALGWIQKRTSRPFFCWIHLFDAHAKYDSRSDQFGDRFQETPYDAGIAVEVQQLDRVLKLLRETNQDQNTLTVIVGDHGEGLGEHLETEHGVFAYNSTIAVPLVFGGPSICLPGHRVSNGVSLVDIFPTVLDVLNISGPKHVSGRSLSAALQGQTIPVRPCYAESETPFLENQWCPIHVAILDRWKYIHTTKAELYDLDADPGESMNVIEQFDEEHKTMLNVLEAMQDKFRPTNAQNIKLTAKDESLLKSLGYVSSKISSKDSESSKLGSLPDMKEMISHYSKLREARHIYADGQFELAIKMTQEVLSETNDCPMAYLYLGEFLGGQGRLNESLIAYRAFLKIKPANALGHAQLGRALMLLGNTSQAIDEFRETLRLEPEATKTHFDLAQALLKLNLREDAIIEFKEALRYEPDFVMAHIQLGITLGNLNRHKEAEKSFRSAIEFDPKPVLGNTLLAHSQIQQGQFKNAIESAQTVIKLDPSSFDGRLLLGMALASNNQFAEALVQLEESQILRPNDPRPKQQIYQIKSLQQKVR